MLKGLYVITDEKLTPYENGKIILMVERALKGGAKLVQLRDKSNKDEDLLEIAKDLKNLCKRFGAYFLINDRVNLAYRIEADGVHLGIEDTDLKEVKKILKNKIIGVSCYGDLERAVKAELEGATYVSFGSFFPSPTKPNAKVVDKNILVSAKKLLRIPVCAIGGITLEKAKELIELGADLIAVISDIWKAKDIEIQARAYTALFNR